MHRESMLWPLLSLVWILPSHWPLSQLWISAALSTQRIISQKCLSYKRAKAWNVVIALLVLLQMCVFLFVIVTFFIFFRMLFYLWLLFPGGLRAEPGEKCDAWQVWWCAWWCAWCDGALSLKYVVKDKFKMDSPQMINFKSPIKRFSPKHVPLFLRSAIFGKLVMMLPWPSQWTIRWTSSSSTY